MLSSHGNVSLPWNCFTVCKKKLGCKGNSSHEMFITLLRFFAPYFLFQFSHSLVYLRSIDKEEKAAQFWHGKIQGVWVEVILAFSITYFCTNTGFKEVDVIFGIVLFFDRVDLKFRTVKLLNSSDFWGTFCILTFIASLAHEFASLAKFLYEIPQKSYFECLLEFYYLFYALLASLTNNQMEIH